MNRALWRIAAETPDYPADDLGGGGARSTGGRWNAAGFAVTYASRSRALACLETLVHFKASSLPLNRYLVRIDVPEAIWAKAERLDAETAPIGWDAEPAGLTSIRTGTNWLVAGTSCLLLVPSIVVPEEHNVLINPAHADSAGLVATKVRRWLYDPRLGL